MDNPQVEYTHDADGLRVYSGDTIWVKGTICGWYSRVVKCCYKLKVEFTEEGPDGYIGARYNLIHIQAPWGKDDCIRKA